MDEVAELRERVEGLEQALTDLALRYSALEWIVEQHFSFYLHVDHPDGAADFLDGISQPLAPAFQATPQGPMPVRPDHAATLAGYIDHIAGKVRQRVAQGLRHR